MCALPSLECLHGTDHALGVSMVGSSLVLDSAGDQ